jgi:hypothetical protein
MTLGNQRQRVMPPAPWETEAIIHHSQRLLQSFHHYLGRPLLPDLRAGSPRLQAQQLFEAPCIVVSHGIEDEPIFNYGNALALALWELSWTELIRFPSRQTAQGADQPERAKMLAQAKAQGYFEGYVGDRTTASGQRFRMEDGLIWTVVDETGAYCGQAATFSQYHFL